MTGAQNTASATCQSCPVCGGFCGLDGAKDRVDGCFCRDPWFCSANHTYRDIGLDAGDVDGGDRG